jgi:hypothetical protein
MRKLGALGIALILLIAGIGLIGCAINADKPEDKDMKGNTTKFMTGTGFDPYGYNYVAHLYSGSYVNVYLGRETYAGGAWKDYPPYEGDTDAYYQKLVDLGIATDLTDAANKMSSHWAWPYRDVDLIMKWNEAWLSNKDQDNDGFLDRHYGFDSYIGSGAWITNHQTGKYDDGTKWNYFVKIVAAPTSGYKEGGFWYSADGTEIGPVIWGSFAIIEQIDNDPIMGNHGVSYVSDYASGFGAYKYI